MPGLRGCVGALIAAAALAAAPGAAAKAPRGVVVAQAGAGAEDNQAWLRAREINTAEAYRAYLARFPAGRHAEAARRRIQNRQLSETRAAREQALGLTRADRAAVEADLLRLGYQTGPIDGRLDPRTREAIRAYREDNGLPRHAWLDRFLVERLEIDASRGRRD